MTTTSSALSLSCKSSAHGCKVINEGPVGSWKASTSTRSRLMWRWRSGCYRSWSKGEELRPRRCSCWHGRWRPTPLPCHAPSLGLLATGTKSREACEHHCFDLADDLWLLQHVLIEQVLPFIGISVLLHVSCVVLELHLDNVSELHLDNVYNCDVH